MAKYPPSILGVKKSLFKASPEEGLISPSKVLMIEVEDKDLIVEVVKELSEEDLRLASEARAKSRKRTGKAGDSLLNNDGGSDIAQLSGIRYLRPRHHRQAELIAQGRTAKDVAMIVGVDQARMSVLLQDPAFIELVSYYRDQQIGTMHDYGIQFRADLLDVSHVALREIQSRLDDEEIKKKLPLGELRKCVELGADRTVAPPRSVSAVTTAPTEITLNFGTPPVPPATIIENPPQDDSFEARRAAYILEQMGD
jgi:hypothetical protein